MKIKYFRGVSTQQELRKEFVKLLKIHHPDNGGNAETCKEINAEYEYLMQRLPKHATGESKTENAEEKKAAADLDKEIRDLVNKIIYMEGINIEIVGVWIWVDGNTFPYKEELKEYGFKWSRSRKKWHACPYGESAYYKGRKKDFDVLRAIYGSSTVNTNASPLLT